MNIQMTVWGPATYSHWSFQCPEMTAGPKERAAVGQQIKYYQIGYSHIFLLHFYGHKVCVHLGLVHMSTLRTSYGEYLPPLYGNDQKEEFVRRTVDTASIQRNSAEVSHENCEADCEGSQYLQDTVWLSYRISVAAMKGLADHVKAICTTRQG